MKLFEKTRIQVFLQGGKFYREKSGQRRWRMNLVVAVDAHEILSCDEMLVSNYQSMDAALNKIEELKIAAVVPDQCLSFFGLADHDAPVITLGRCGVSELRFTRTEGLLEFWMRVEHECTDALHAFVRDYAFTRFWAEFAPVQMSLGDVPTRPGKTPEVASTPKQRVN